MGTHECDKQNADCTKIVGSYLCKCKEDFVGDGKTCVDGMVHNKSNVYMMIQHLFFGKRTYMYIHKLLL